MARKWLRDLEALVAAPRQSRRAPDRLLSDLLAKRDQWLHPSSCARASADLRVTLEATLRGWSKRHLAILANAGELTVAAKLLWQLAQFAAAQSAASGRR